MIRLPRLPRALLVALAAALALTAAARLGRPRLEARIRAGIEGEAARRGLLAQVQSVHVGLWPPLRLEGLRVEKPGAWSLATDTADLTLRLRGRGVIGRTRLDLGPVTASGPAGWTLESAPTQWDIVRVAPDGWRAELRGPAGRLEASWLPSATGSRFDWLAADLPAGELFAVRHAGLPIADAGVVTGRVHVAHAPGASRFAADVVIKGLRVASLSNNGPLAAGEAPAFGQATDVALRLEGSWRSAAGALDLRRWQLNAGGAAASGSLALAGVPDDPRVDLALDVERVDFMRLFGSSGVSQPEALAFRIAGGTRPGDLGSASLSARVTGRLLDPASFSVAQRLDFTPPPHIPPALERLRAAFVHEVLLTGGGRKAIDVSPASADFIALHDVPPLFVRTLLLAEDAGFFGHRGIDLRELPSAVLTNWARGGASRGASTITQQLAKNLFLSREKSLGRKLQELCLALLLEATLGKERILEIYLNVIEWGPDLHGLRPAARRYFRKEPRELTPRQMAFLVALIPGPVKYQRSFAHGTLAPGFRPLVDDLLAKLCSQHALSDEEYAAAVGEELIVETEPPASGYP